ncbi:MAG: lytic transglycosylase domain-containing protein [Sphaerobacter sp.]|nr:lytic transglycosylase domain-containing protein [Sphaerobacter sp.]
MNRWRLLGSAITASVAVMLATPTAHGADLTLNPRAAQPPVPSIWSRTDSPAARSGPNRSWLWGPSIRSITREPYTTAPTGSRQVFYFDKARLEITDPNGDPNSLWYASSGLLIREMLTGRIQVGDDAYVQTDPAPIPVTGDVADNPISPTYATLAPLASGGGDIEAARRPPRLDQPVTALLHADGTVDEQGVPGSAVRVASYDQALGHNVADVFAQWIAAQPLAWEYVVGHPLTEPYWVDTRVNGVPRRVLVQAFERRVLTYTPDNPPGWQVEAGNAGLHYRIWRWLRMPDDQNLIALAAGVPLGEVIVGKAVEHGIDPFLFASLAKVASNFNPLAQMGNGGVGLFGVRPEVVADSGQAHPLDPVVNAELAARVIAPLRTHLRDWRAVLAIYYTGAEHPDWSDPGLNAFVSNVLDTMAQMLAEFNHPPTGLLGGEEPAPELSPAAPRHIATGPAAFYSPGYTVGWWAYTLERHAGWGNAVPGWAPDPNGYYCVHPDFRPGQRLQLSANGVTLWCTIGDAVAAGHQPAWRARWAVELSYNTFLALHLNQRNVVEVRAP